jgi:hypothetical protein
MFCSQCGTEIDDDSTECHSCSATTQLGQSELDPGRKTGAAALRSLGMFILAGSITIWLAWLLLFGSTFPIIYLIFACVVGGGMHYAGRKMDPHAHSATSRGIVGGAVGGIVIVVGFIIAFVLAVLAFIGGIFG